MFRLWPRLFPWLEKDVAELQDEVEPYLGTLKKFRHKTAFHAAATLEEHQTVRLAMNDEGMGRAMDRLLKFCVRIRRKEEAKVPGLQETMAEYGL